MHKATKQITLFTKVEMLTLAMTESTAQKIVKSAFELAQQANRLLVSVMHDGVWYECFVSRPSIHVNKFRIIIRSADYVKVLAQVEFLYE
jgi:hypothetical protein